MSVSNTRFWKLTTFGKFYEWKVIKPYCYRKDLNLWIRSVVQIQIYFQGALRCACPFFVVRITSYFDPAVEMTQQEALLWSCWYSLFVCVHPSLSYFPIFFISIFHRYPAASLLRHCCVTAVSLLCHCCVTAASLLRHCCVTAVSLLCHCSCCVSLALLFYNF